MNSDHLDIVNKIIEKELKEKPLEIKRMVIGICNEVYLVVLKDKKVIVRMNIDELRIQGTEKHIALFKSLNINVPNIIASDYSKKEFSVAYQVLSYIEGQDLGGIIESLSDDELKNLAKEVSLIFKKLETIGTNGRFGWVGVDENRLVNSWAEIMKQDKVEERNNQTGVVGIDLVNKEKELYLKYQPYFSSVKSTLFYDNISSKNILINQGKFAGLVDLDDITYGDPLCAVGGIKASWYGTHYGAVYTKAVEDELNLTFDQRKMVTAYALFDRILWLSEKGIKFNDNTSEEINVDAVRKDKEIINQLILELEG